MVAVARVAWVRGGRADLSERLAASTRTVCPTRW